MRSTRFNPYPNSALLLIAVSVILMIIATYFGRGDISSAMLVLAAVTSFITGVIIFTFHEGEGVSREFASLLPSGGMISLARSMADLGVGGNARFFPAGDGAPATVMQVNPVGDALPSSLDWDKSFLFEGEAGAMVTVPSGVPLLMMLMNDHGLKIPDDEDLLFHMIEDLFEGLLGITEKVGIERSGDALLVTLYGYSLISGCKCVSAESPRCCALAPCPVCSLVACMVTLSLNVPCTIVSAVPDLRKRRLSVVISPLLSSEDDDDDDQNKSE